MSEGQHGERVTLGEIKQLAGVGRPTVSNWRRRFAREVLEAANDKRPAFPDPVAGTDGKPLFDAEEIACWLDLRPLPDADTEKDGEPVTYGERFRQELKVRGLVALRYETRSADRLIAQVLAVLAMDAEGEAWVPEYLPPTLLPDRAAATARVRDVARELAEVRGGEGAAADEVLNLAGRLESDLAMDATPQTVVDLVSLLVGSLGGGTDEQASVINLCAGTGELLLGLKDLDGHGDLVAVEPDAFRRTLLISRLLCHWLGSVDVFASPTDLDTPQALAGLGADASYRLSHADIVVADPPYASGERDRDEDGPLGWALEALRRLNPQGRGYVVVPSWTLARPRTAEPTPTVRMRQELLDRDSLAAIIQLPRRIHPFRTGAEHALLVLRRDASSEDRGRVLLVDADRIAGRVGADWPRHVAEILRTRTSPVAEEARYATVQASAGAEALADGRSVLPAHRLASPEQGLDHFAATRDARQSAFDVLPQLKEWLGGLGVRKRSESVRHIKVGDQLKAGSLRLLAGHRIRESDIGDAGVPVIGREEMLGALPIGSRRILPEHLVAYPQAMVTDRGDVFLLTEHGVRTQVDDAGGCVLLAPVQGLRIAAYRAYLNESAKSGARHSESLWMRPQALARLLAAPRNQRRGSGSLVRRVSVRDMDLPQLPREEIADLEAILAEAERHRAEVRRQLAALDTLAERLAAGVADGDLRLRQRQPSEPGPRA
ncbi:N-6 DNA methylase [Streptomyces sp. NPDC048669]|uniref:N-6 DNA methylase n=1 Tax=Streptomyces sp. NPDC048669 TaxID=3155267 RepID=UPI00342CCBFF